MVVGVVPLSEVWQLRQQVMYPFQDMDMVKLDNDAEGTHLGMYDEEELLSVISLFCSDKKVQFRKFATRMAFQRKGIGSALLQHVMDWAQANGYEVVWCNARLTAVELYKQFGMEPVGESWIKNGIEYIKMQKEL